MSTDMKKQVLDYIGKCRKCTIATASDDKPAASTVFFNNNNYDIYFNTGSKSEKVKNIKENPHVAIVMEIGGKAAGDQENINGIQYFGTARILTDADSPDIPKAVLTRHKVFNSAGSEKSVIIAVSPRKIALIDYSKGFRHRDTITF